MGAIWNLVTEIGKTVINVHSCAAFDIAIIEDDEKSSSYKSETTSSECYDSEYDNDD
jgi:hypothetical protein